METNKLAELLRKAREARNIPAPSPNPIQQKTHDVSERISEVTINAITHPEKVVTGIGRTGEVITYNKEQLEFIEISTSGESAILIGAAGTGKTTCTRGFIETLIQSGKAGILEADGHKYLPHHGAPGIVAVSFTRRAVMNLRKAMPEDMKGNCITIHKLLEYEPVYYETEDPITHETKNTMRFEPTRTKLRPLPASIRTIIIDESSMVSVELFTLLKDALPHEVQFIFLGDIQQLPPVFGSAILGYKMLELKTVELIQVYRQALESPIIRLAHRILSGIPIANKSYSEWDFPQKLKLHPWKKKLSADVALLTAAKFFTTAIEHGSYDPNEDMILIPFNKAFGTDELNKHIAQFIARKNQRITYEVISGFQKFYFSVGDKVLYDKEDAEIIDIKVNPTYTGKKPQDASLTLDYWGHEQNSTVHKTESEMTEDQVEFLMSQVAIDSEDRVNEASHIITVKMVDSQEEIDLKSVSAVTSLIMGYALTVHKSQGSEWRKVFLVLHQSHATMLQRELLYTAVTRAKEELYVICEPESFTNGILSQRIKGNTLKEKAEYFKGKVENGDYKLV